MTSSGVKSYEPNLAAIIKDAYQECGTIGILDTPSAEQHVKGRNKLNRMVSEWMKNGLKIWTIEEGVLFLQKSQRRYQFGSSSTDHYTDAYDFDNTTLAAAAASGATAITVAAIGTIANGDNIAVQLDSGSFQWTTVNGAPVGTTVTLAVALTGAAASGNRVVAYTSKHLRPLDIMSGRYLNLSSLNETRTDKIAHNDYMELPNKTNTASPFVRWQYQPKTPNGVLNVWLTPSDVTHAMRYTYRRPIFDFIENADTADFPIEWANALVFGLAAELVPSCSVPKERADRIIAMAAAKLALVSGADQETASVLYQPDIEEYN